MNETSVRELQQVEATTYFFHGVASIVLHGENFPDAPKPVTRSVPRTSALPGGRHAGPKVPLVERSRFFGEAGLSVWRLPEWPIIRPLSKVLKRY